MHDENIIYPYKRNTNTILCFKTYELLSFSIVKFDDKVYRYNGMKV